MMTIAHPPEYPAQDFDPIELGQTLRTRGAVLLRGLLPAGHFATWLPVFEVAYARYDARYEAGLLDEQNVQNLYRYGNVQPGYIQQFGEWLKQTLGEPRLRGFLGAYFGKDAYLLRQSSAPRRQGPVHPEHALVFHQDQEFLGPMQRAINVWVPLTPAGGDWPGLELQLDAPQLPLLSMAMSVPEREAVCAGLPPESLWRPVLTPGDVLIFTPYTVHRTWLEPTMNHTRISSEIRLISGPDTHLSTSPLMHFDFSNK